MRIIQRIPKNSFIYLCLVGFIVEIAIEMLFKFIGMISPLNKLIFELINQAVASHFLDTEVGKILLNISVWIISVFVIALALLLANTLVGKFLRLFEKSSYVGYTGQICFKSGTYKARVNLDYSVDVLAGRMFPLGVTKSHQIVPTAWEFSRPIKNRQGTTEIQGIAPMRRIKSLIKTLRERYYYKRGMLDKIPDIAAPYPPPRHHRPNLAIQLDEEFPNRLGQFLIELEHSLTDKGLQGSRDRILEFFVTTIFQLYSKHMRRTVSLNQDPTLGTPHILKITTDEIGFSADLAIAALECDILHNHLPQIQMDTQADSLKGLKPPNCS